MWKTLHVRSHEIALWFRHGDLHRVLEPGRHRMPVFGANAVEVHDTLQPAFRHDRLRALVRDERLASRLEVLDLVDDERALVWIDGRLQAIEAGGVHAYWTSSGDVVIERFDLGTLRFEHPRLQTIQHHPGSSRHFHGLRVDAHEHVLLFRDGALAGELGAGHHVFWRGGPSVTWQAVDLREQVADIQGQEIMTQDKVTLRLNLVVTHRVVDPLRAVTEVVDRDQALHREAQLELRAAVGGRTLERLLADKDEVGAEIRNRLAERAHGFGVAVSSVGLRDIILPGDMKSILNEVIVAQKQAEANLIRRREETAAARSQANTARLLAENPVLARMKELEALQEVLRGTKATFVLGGSDLAEQLGTLVGRPAQDDPDP